MKLFLVMGYLSSGSLATHLRGRFYAADIGAAMGPEHHLLQCETQERTLGSRWSRQIFGLSKVCVADIDGAMNVCVAPAHIAPEVLEAQPCTKAADWWSFGILPYEMIGGRPPYYHRDNDTVFQAIRNQERIVFSPSYSDSAVSLILGLLTRDPTMRLGSGPRDADEVLTHPFFESISWPGLLEKRIPPQVTVVSTRTTRHARTTLGSQGPSSVESNVFSGHQ